MNFEIQVKDVIERNDCYGRKQIFVTSMGKDESVESVFRLYHGYMSYHDKLNLASVSPMDTVRVLYDEHGEMPEVVGEYVENLSDTWNRDPICRCGTAMVSDGFDIFCRNDRCGLTIAARIKRLSDTIFFRSEMMELDIIEGFFDKNGVAVYDDVNYCKPFLSIQQGLFWGEPGGSLEHILLTRDMGDISIATFLVPNLFQDFTETVKSFHPHVYNNISRFYGEIEEFRNRRDYDSPKQNQLIHQFIWSLGIESLTEDIIFRLCQQERMIEDCLDPFLFYIYMLTHPNEMITDLGLHRLEANSILEEILRRKYEMFDIFYYHANNKDDVSNIFKGYV